MYLFTACSKSVIGIAGWTFGCVAGLFFGYLYKIVMGTVIQDGHDRFCSFRKSNVIYTSHHQPISNLTIWEPRG